MAYYVHPYRVVSSKVCSRRCSGKLKLGKPTWNTGLKGVQKCSPETREKLSAAKRGKPSNAPVRRGEQCWNWKGQKVSYRSLHKWVERQRGKANHCEECGRNRAPILGATGKALKGTVSYFQWANISHQYKRILEDWKQLCYKCHKAFDRQARLTAN